MQFSYCVTYEIAKMQVTHPTFPSLQVGRGLSEKKLFIPCFYIKTPFPNCREGRWVTHVFLWFLVGKAYECFIGSFDKMKQDLFESIRKMFKLPFQLKNHHLFTQYKICTLILHIHFISQLWLYNCCHATHRTFYIATTHVKRLY